MNDKLETAAGKAAAAHKKPGNFLPGCQTSQLIIELFFLVYEE